VHIIVESKVVRLNPNKSLSRNRAGYKDHGCRPANPRKTPVKSKHENAYADAMSNRSRSDTDDLNDHDSLARAELQEAPVSQL